MSFFAKALATLGLAVAISCCIVAMQPDEAVAPAAKPHPAQPQHGQWLAAVPVAAALPEASLIAQIDALLATGKPVDAWRAYQKVALCADYAKYKGGFYDSDHDGNPVSDDVNRARQEACATLSQRMLTSRLDYLAIAFNAGIPDAALATWSEGPFGDETALKFRPDDPLVVQWKRDVAAMLHRHAQDGHSHTLLMLSMELKRERGRLAEQDRTLALTYALARGRLAALRNYSDTSKNFEEWLEEVTKKGMSPEQIAAADAAANMLVGRWRTVNRK